MGQKKPTMDEHFVPKFYLRGFAENDRLYQYDVINGSYSGNPVPVNSICFEKNIYEFKNQNGSIDHLNMLENLLHIIETNAAEIIRSVCSKAHNKNNEKTLCFLSTNEKKYLILFMGLLILRNPEILNIASELSKDFATQELTDIMAKNIALAVCLPLIPEIDWTNSRVLLEVLNWFENKSFVILISRSEEFITSDFPVTIIGDYQTIKKILFPLSSDVALEMEPNTEANAHYRNRLIETNDSHVDFFNIMSATGCLRWVYSKNGFSKKQMRSFRNRRNQG